MCIDAGLKERQYNWPNVPKEVYDIEIKTLKAINQAAEEKGYNKQLGMKLPEIFIKEGLKNVNVFGKTNIHLDCAVNKDDVEKTIESRKIMMERNKRRFQGLKESGVLTDEEYNLYFDYWEKTLERFKKNPGLLLKSPNMTLSVMIIARGQK
ncbi:hypothetical protein BBF96_07440 [Anoxybacter fermentans]|uniref:Uncharacterized protein n=1 Tax=Anoxybacter fermentans TaxID=1323375 RepID=A0A3Q9HQ70_9FIRM|nr:hypothetical protein BBF96_07440 [Anoxybacter fermentans]